MSRSKGSFARAALGWWLAAAVITSPVITSSVITVITVIAAATPLAARDEAARVVPAEPVDVDLGEELRRLIGAARDQVFPALVSIRVITVDYRGGKELKGAATGSGVLISTAGHVVTNQHVTSKGKRFTCTLSDKREVAARLVGEDPLTDLAVLAIDLEALDDPATPLPVARFGDSDRLQIGDHVMAMGSPFSLSRSVSLGIVSNTERVFAGGFGNDEIDEMQLEQGQRTGLFTRWIQHDALINPGNSGGPLVNLDGEVVGINELGGNAIGFAIPSNLVRKVAAALIAHGEVPRSWLGMSLRSIGRTPFDHGVLVDSVVLDGPAAAAGLAAGDLITALDGEPVTVRFLEQVPLLLGRLASLPSGSRLEVTYQRDGESATTALTTEVLGRDLGDEAAFAAWGLSVQAITDKMARDWRLDGTAGVLVTGVRAGGPAQLAEPALEAGDVVLALDGVAVPDLDAALTRYQAASEAALDAEPPPVLVEFDRRGKNHLTLIRPRVDDVNDPPRELPKAWIGVATQPVLPGLAEALGLGDQRGFRVTRIYPGTRAAAAGLEIGDLIVALDDQPLRPNGIQDSGILNRAVRALSIDDNARLTILRGGELVEVPIVLERTRLTPEEARSHRDSEFELSVRELTFFDRDENRWDAEVLGVLVERVEIGSWAQLGGIRPRDLVQRIDDRPIRGLQTFRKALQDLKRTRPERIAVLVLRGTKTHLQYLEPDWNPLEPD